MRQAGHVARTEEERKLYKVLVGKPKGKRAHERRRIRWGLGSEWILGRLTGVLSGLSWPRIGTGGGFL
jgi:hypothetical protein